MFTILGKTFLGMGAGTLLGVEAANHALRKGSKELEELQTREEELALQLHKARIDAELEFSIRPRTRTPYQLHAECGGAKRKAHEERQRVLSEQMDELRAAHASKLSEFRGQLDQVPETIFKLLLRDISNKDAVLAVESPGCKTTHFEAPPASTAALQSKKEPKEQEAALTKEVEIAGKSSMV